MNKKITNNNVNFPYLYSMVVMPNDDIVVGYCNNRYSHCIAKLIFNGNNYNMTNNIHFTVKAIEQIHPINNSDILYCDLLNLHTNVHLFTIFDVQSNKIKKSRVIMNFTYGPRRAGHYNTNIVTYSDEYKLKLFDLDGTHLKTVEFDNFKNGFDKYDYTIKHIDGLSDNLIVAQYVCQTDIIARNIINIWNSKKLVNHCAHSKEM